MALGIVPPRSWTEAPPVMRGVIWMLVSTVFYGSIVLVIRHLSQSIPVFELVFFRALMSVLLALPVLARGGMAGLRTHRPALHFWRAALAYSGMLTWFYALSTIPLAEAASLQYTMPLFTVLLAIMFLGEKVGPMRWAAVAIGFIGALIILRPGMIEVSLAALGVLFTSLVYSGVNIVTRVAARTDPPTAMIATMFGFMVVLSAGPAAYVWVTPGWAEIPWIIALGVISFCGSQCTSRAYGLAEASLITPIGFLKLPYIAIAALILFGEFPDGWTVLGAAVILMSTTIVTRSEARRRGAAKT